MSKLKTYYAFGFSEEQTEDFNEPIYLAADVAREFRPLLEAMMSQTNGEGEWGAEAQRLLALLPKESIEQRLPTDGLKRSRGES